MLLDSTYQIGEQIIPTKVGALVGLAGGTLVLISLMLSGLIDDFNFQSFFIGLGQIIWRGNIEPTFDKLSWITGFLFFTCLAMLSGLMYALCQYRPIQKSGLIGVGIFYGFLHWIMINIIHYLFFKQQITNFFFSLSGLGVFLIYGLCLALTAIFFEVRYLKRGEPLLPKD